MRLRVAGLGRVVKRDLGIEFGREQLTSYGGLELVRRYFQSIGLNRRIRQGFREHHLGGDYGCLHLVVLVIGLLVVVRGGLSNCAMWRTIHYSRGCVVWRTFPRIGQ